MRHADLAAAAAAADVARPTSEVAASSWSIAVGCSMGVPTMRQKKISQGSTEYVQG